MECQPGRQHATVTVAMKRTLLWDVNQVGSMLTCPCNLDTLHSHPLTSSHNLCYPTAKTSSVLHRGANVIGMIWVSHLILIMRKLICAFVFAYAKSRFSHDASHSTFSIFSSYNHSKHHTVICRHDKTGRGVGSLGGAG